MRASVPITLLLLLVLSACDDDPVGPEGPDPGDTVVSDHAVVLDSESRSRLIEVDGDGVLTFSSRTGLTDRVEEGDVIVSDVTDAAPYGFIGRVVEKRMVGDALEIETAPATLEDVFDQARIEIEKELSAGDLAAPTGLRGVRVEASRFQSCGFDSEFRIYLDFDSLVIYDSDGDHDTAHDQVVFDGCVGLNPEFRFIWVRGLQGGMREVGIHAGAEVRAGIEVLTGVRVPIEPPWLTVAELPFSPITVLVGPVPVVLFPVMGVRARITGEIEVGMVLETGVGASWDLDFGWRREGGGYVESDSDLEFEPVGLNATASMKVKPTLELPLEVRVYNLAGPEARPSLFIEADVDVFDDPWWKVDLGLEADAAFVFGALSPIIPDLDFPGVIGVRVPIADAGGPFTFVPVEAAIDCPSELDINEVGVFTASLNDDASEPIGHTWDFGDGTSGDGLLAAHSFASPGTYTVSFTATGPINSDSESCIVKVAASPVITNLDIEFISLNDCTTPDITNGSRYRYTFNYYDPEGEVSASSTVTTYGYFSSGTEDIDTFVPRFYGDSYSGTVEFFFCTRFGSSEYVDMYVYLDNDVGQTSNPLHDRVFRPPGGNRTGSASNEAPRPYRPRPAGHRPVHDVGSR